MSDSCIIIGNGPSLKNVSNNVLGSLPTFGSNGILLKFDPTYYVAVNPLAIKRFWDLIVVSQAEKFLSPNTGNIAYKPLYSTPLPLFSYAPLRYIYEGYTVTFVSLQLAFAMEFTTVYLVGVDHKYSFDGNPNEEHTWIGDDSNHFDPSYFRDSQWNNPDLAQAEHSYRLAKKAYEDDDRRIINCTPGSALEVFEMGELPT